MIQFTPSTLSTFEMLQEDLLAMNPDMLPNGWSIVWLTLTTISFRAVFLYRLSHALYYKSKATKFLTIIIKTLNLWLNGCELRPESYIGPGLRLPHPCGVDIGVTRMGKNVTVMERVTIGTRTDQSFHTDHTHWPTVGDNVIFSPGAVAVGSIIIGDHAILGPNSVVIKDVPAYANADGVPAKITMRNARIAS